MTIFLRLLDDVDKAAALLSAVNHVKAGTPGSTVFSLPPESFRSIPTSPFAYWVSDCVRDSFRRNSSMNSTEREAWMGLSTGANFQWLRLLWEVPNHLLIGSRKESREGKKWAFLAKGGEFATFYQKFHVVVDWSGDGQRLGQWKLAELEMGRTSENNSKCWNQTKYFRPGVTWSARSQKGASFRALPPNSIFGSKGPAILVSDNQEETLLALVALTNSSSFALLLSIQMAFGSYEVGTIKRTPVPNLDPVQRNSLADACRRSWSLKRTLDSVEETSLAFLLPTLLRTRLGGYDPEQAESELANIQNQINDIAFDLYKFEDGDRAAIDLPILLVDDITSGDVSSDDDAETEVPADSQPALLSWCVGVLFGRFDWRLATGERAAPPEPSPFDPLPTKSPGSLPDGAEPFHAHLGILVDDQGHPHDLAHLVEEVFGCVDMPIPDDVRRWLQKDFFAFHLQRYSKSRRKAPIYWPLSTASGSYTLWIYYPSLSSQTLYTAINDFVEPKLRQVDADVATLRNKGTARSREDEKQFESLQSFELELIELRDILLKLAPTYKPNHDDGVQISAAPLWPLFRHKPWQKVLKDTWAKLEKGDYDWAHLAMNYWPERVREKCKTDKSLAIAHSLENLYVEPEAKPKKARGRKKAGGDE